MPITVKELKALFELEEREKGIMLGTYLYNLGRKEKGANPTEDIRSLREDRYEFRGR